MHKYTNKTANYLNSKRLSSYVIISFLFAFPCHVHMDTIWSSHIIFVWLTKKYWLNFFPVVFFPASIYLPKGNNGNTRSEICSKLTIKTPEQCQWCQSGVFIANFERNFEHVIADCVALRMPNFYLLDWRQNLLKF